MRTGTLNTLANLPFLKMNGLGNEIVVLDLRGSSHIITEREARAIGQFDRAKFEQLMVLHDPISEGTDAFVRIYNADGSEAGACGNGTRCVAYALLRNSDRTTILIETIAGQLICTRVSDELFTVDMGTPLFAWHDIPLREEVPDTSALPLSRHMIGLPPLEAPVAVNMGNPHAVFFVDNTAAYDLTALGPSLEHDPLFPKRANISFAQVIDRNHIKLRVWERGAGETQACGSGACATAIAAIKRGFTNRNVRVSLPGGDLIIEWRMDDHVLMTGPAALEWEDQLPPNIFKDTATS